MDHILPQNFLDQFKSKKVTSAPITWNMFESKSYLYVALTWRSEPTSPKPHDEPALTNPCNNHTVTSTSESSDKTKESTKRPNKDSLHSSPKRLITDSMANSAPVDSSSESSESTNVAVTQVVDNNDKATEESQPEKQTATINNQRKLPIYRHDNRQQECWPGNNRQEQWWPNNNRQQDCWQGNNRQQDCWQGNNRQQDCWQGNNRQQNWWHGNNRQQDCWQGNNRQQDCWQGNNRQQDCWQGNNRQQDCWQGNNRQQDCWQGNNRQEQWWPDNNRQQDWWPCNNRQQDWWPNNNLQRDLWPGNNRQQDCWQGNNRQRGCWPGNIQRKATKGASTKQKPAAEVSAAQSNVASPRSEPSTSESKTSASMTLSESTTLTNTDSDDVVFIRADPPTAAHSGMIPISRIKQEPDHEDKPSTATTSWKQRKHFVVKSSQSFKKEYPKTTNMNIKKESNDEGHHPESHIDPASRQLTKETTHSLTAHLKAPGLACIKDESFMVGGRV